MKKNILLIVSITAILFLTVSCLSEESQTPVGVAGRTTSGNNYTNPETLRELIEEKEKPYILIDVRTAEEYASGHIPSAINIPYDVIHTNLPEEAEDVPVILYCRSGNRSGTAYNTLKELGYTDIYDFGGVNRWRWELNK